MTAKTLKKQNSIGLSCYHIRLNQKGDTTPIPFNSFSSKTLYETIKAHLIGRTTAEYVDALNKQSYSIDTHFLKHCDSTKRIWGLANAGESGISAVGKKAGKQVYTRDPNTSEEIPLYFLMVLPDNALEGYIIFQSFRHRKMKSIVSADLIDSLQTLNPNLICKVLPTLPDFLLNRQMCNATPRKVILSGRFKPKIDSEAVAAEKGLIDTPRRELKATLVLSPLEGDFSLLHTLKATMLKLSTGTTNENAVNEFTELLTIENDDIDFNEAKLIVDINGSSRTIKFHGANQMTPDYEITDNLTFNEKSNHPTFDSVHDEALKLLKDLSMSIPHNNIGDSENAVAL